MGDRTDRESPDERVSRRQYLGLKTAAATALLAGCAESDDADGNQHGDEAPDARVTVDPTTRNDRPVPETLFGRFAEHYGDQEIYPGIVAEHVTNTCFVSWTQVQGNDSHVYGPDDIGTYDEIPFPWEPVGAATYERRDEGGVRGLGTWHSTGEFPTVGTTETFEYQQLTVDGPPGGVAQRLVLPDWRTLEYELTLSARSAGLERLEARLRTLDGTVLARTDVGPVENEWRRLERTLELAAASGGRLQGGAGNTIETPYGEYVLELVGEGNGTVALDWVSLIPADAVTGERTGARYNPTTIELMDDRNVSLLKWPGGNVTSTYNWKDGIGPVGDRPVRPNVVWDGVEPNRLGTAEYVEFCELVGVEPTITVGVTVEDTDRAFQPPEEITPEDAANWVEYCNGDTDTEYGSLRAEHGYEEPFDVEVWEVGNEVWGDWQAGGTDDPEQFADRVVEFATAMRAVDDSITIIPDGMDPLYRDPWLPDPIEWNEAVFEVAGENVDGIGMHRYNWGISADDGAEGIADDDGAQAAIEDWKTTNDADAIDYNEVLLMFPTQFGELVTETAGLAADNGFEDPEIMVGEWGLFPTVGDGDPWPGMPTMAGASYVAGMYNTFIRESDVVRRGCHTHLPVRLFPPVNAEQPPNPLNPVGYTLGLYANVFDDDREWDAVQSSVDGERRDLPETGFRIRAMEDVPYVDSVTVATVGSDALCTFMTNRNLRTGKTVALDLPDSFEDGDVAVTIQQPTGDPHDQQTGLGDVPESWFDWTGIDSYEIVADTRPVPADGTVTITLDPSAVARIEIE